MVRACKISVLQKPSSPVGLRPPLATLSPQGEGSERLRLNGSEGEGSQKA
jgi:hypothetical protein